MLSDFRQPHLKVLLEDNAERIQYKVPVSCLQKETSNQCLTYRNHHTGLHHPGILQARLQEPLFHSGHFHNRKLHL